MLFDEQRKLFSIGYQALGAALDSSFYDLLASEARLASFFAIAKDDVPPEHWFRLGRSLTVARRRDGARVVERQHVRVSHAAARHALAPVHAARPDVPRRRAPPDRATGASAACPWGISESAYNVRDRHDTYQYRAFGVPDLGAQARAGEGSRRSRRTPRRWRSRDAARGAENLAVLEREGALGPYGFYDALDYTRTAPDEPRRGRRHLHGASRRHEPRRARQRAHRPTIWQRRFLADPLVRAAALLLDERDPAALRAAGAAGRCGHRDAASAASASAPAVHEVRHADTRRAARRAARRPCRTASCSPMPAAATAATSGSTCPRWRADATRDDTGQWVLHQGPHRRPRLVAPRTSRWAAIADRYRAIFAADRVELPPARRRRSRRGRRSSWSPDEQAEVRRVTLINRSRTEREIELTSYGEIVLAPAEADRAHPAFRICSSRPSGVADAQRAAREPPPAGGRRAVALVRARRRGRARSRVSAVTLRDRPRAVRRTGALGRAARPRSIAGADALGHGRRRARSDLRAPRARADRAGPLGARRVHHRSWRRRASARIELADRYRRPRRRAARARPRADRSRVELRDLDIAPADSRSSRSWPGRSSTRTRRSARRSTERAAHAGPGGALGAGHLGRLADPPRDDRLGGRPRQRAAPARRAPYWRHKGMRVGSRHSQHRGRRPTRRSCTTSSCRRARLVQRGGAARAARRRLLRAPDLIPPEDARAAPRRGPRRDRVRRPRPRHAGSTCPMRRWTILRRSFARPALGTGRGRPVATPQPADESRPLRRPPPWRSSTASADSPSSSTTR